MSELVNFKNKYLVNTQQRLQLDDAEQSQPDVYFVHTGLDGITIRIAAHTKILPESILANLNKETNEIHVNGVSFCAFVAFLGIFKNDVVAISKDIVADVMELAYRYKIMAWFDVCDRFLKKHYSIEEICNAFELARKYSRIKLARRLEVKIYWHLPIDEVCFALQLAQEFCRFRLADRMTMKIYKHPKAVFTSDRFLNCPIVVLKWILESMDKRKLEPVILFDACMDWSKVACEKNGLDANRMGNRKLQLGDCWNLVDWHFRKMKRNEIADRLSTYPEIFGNIELTRIYSSLAGRHPHRPRQTARKSPRNIHPRGQQ